MNEKRQQQSIYSFLIILILLFGMCFDCVQTDSFLLCHSTENCDEHTPTLESGHNISILRQIYASENLEKQTTSALQQQILRRDFRTKTGKGHSFAYLFMYVLPLLLSSILISESYNFLPVLRNTSIIIRYIQRKDGKKPQLSL